mgnify:CR=1 FL=1
MEIAEASERRKVARGDDDVIKHFDFEQLPGADQIACHLDVGITWGTIARGVPVHENQGVRGGRHGQPKNFATMHQKGVLRADGDKLVAFDSAADIQKQNRQTFTFGVEMRMRGDVQFPILGGLVGRVALLQGVRRGALAQRHDFVFVGAGGELERRNQRRRKRSSVHGRFRR